MKAIVALHDQIVPNKIQNTEEKTLLFKSFNLTEIAHPDWFGCSELTGVRTGRPEYQNCQHQEWNQAKGKYKYCQLKPSIKLLPKFDFCIKFKAFISSHTLGGFRCCINV